MVHRVSELFYYKLLDFISSESMLLALDISFSLLERNKFCEDFHHLLLHHRHHLLFDLLLYTLYVAKDHGGYLLLELLFNHTWNASFYVFLNGLVKINLQRLHFMKLILHTLELLSKILILLGQQS